MKETILFGKPACPACNALGQMLDKAGVEYTYIDASKETDKLREYAPTAREVPQLVHNGKLIGGFQQARIAIANGEITECV